MENFKNINIGDKYTFDGKYCEVKSKNDEFETIRVSFFDNSVEVANPEELTKVSDNEYLFAKLHYHLQRIDDILTHYRGYCVADKTRTGANDKNKEGVSL